MKLREIISAEEARRMSNALRGGRNENLKKCLTEIRDAISKGQTEVEVLASNLDACTEKKLISLGYYVGPEDGSVIPMKRKIAW